MPRFKRPNYDNIHGYVERCEDVLLSESSWSTSDSDCSGCLHLSKENLANEDPLLSATVPATLLDQQSAERAPLVTPVASTSRTWRASKSNNGLKSALLSVCSLSRPASTSPSTCTERLATIGVPHSPSSSIRHTGRMLQQRTLLAAGAQPWNKNICASQGQRFAYAATLVIYVYEVIWNLRLNNFNNKNIDVFALKFNIEKNIFSHPLLHPPPIW